MSLPALLVEAFTDRPFRGNGAAVVLLEHPVSDAWMQALARSLNQSETAFVLQADAGWWLRWFTPSTEVPLCGHGTLAALLALQHWQRLDARGQTVFFSRSGPMPVALDGGLGALCLPSAGLQPQVAPPELQQLLSEAVGSPPLRFWRSGLGYSVALLPPEAPLAAMGSPSSRLQPSEAGGLVLMQAMGGSASDPMVAGKAADYQLRFFAPGLGIDEDPVTGSAHALVAPYWLQQLQRPQVVGWQCSPRPGGMCCESASSGMIRLIGTGVLLWSGSLQLQPDDCPGAAESWRRCCASS
ncbi:MAG: PhzF family phenazine biosynthesis protein [Cyanobacteria bacterium K_DeepCast_35m_m2_023]|nr:PhzF family phenazine biosynthesis protein [Cyanobacteria bacterium K_DeepCast_35m_m2_023]